VRTEEEFRGEKKGSNEGSYREMEFQLDAGTKSSSLSQGTYLGNAIKAFGTSSTTPYPDNSLISSLISLPNPSPNLHLQSVSRTRRLKVENDPVILDRLATTLASVRNPRYSSVLARISSILAHSRLESECLIEGWALNAGFRFSGTSTKHSRKLEFPG